MKRTSGYICIPSSGTLSVANGTTNPMVMSSRMSVPPFACASLRRRAGRLDDRRPASNLAANVVAELGRRARQRLHAEIEKMLPRLGRAHEIDERRVQLAHDRPRRVRRRENALPSIGLIAGHPG